MNDIKNIITEKIVAVRNGRLSFIFGVNISGPRINPPNNIKARPPELSIADKVPDQLVPPMVVV